MSSRRKIGANYKKYSEETLAEAVARIRAGQISLRKASRQYRIALGTLSYKDKGNKHLKNVGHPTVFSKREESAFVTHLLTVAKWGFPFDLMDIRVVVNNYLNRIGRNVPAFKNNIPSSKWARGFLIRHAQLTLRMSQNIKKSRAAVSCKVVQEFFNNLRETIDGIPADSLFNYDETNLTDNPGNKKCIFKKGVKYPERVRDSTKSAVSIMFCGSASGNMLPAYVVYKAEHMWSTWTEGGPAETRYNRTKSGWFDAISFTDWFESTFIPHVKKIAGPKVLIGDNLSSHFTETVLKLVEENDIKFVCFACKRNTFNAASRCSVLWTLKKGMAEGFRQIQSSEPSEESDNI